MENKKIEKLEELVKTEWIMYANEKEIKELQLKLLEKINELIEVVNNGK